MHTTTLHGQQLVWCWEWTHLYMYSFIFIMANQLFTQLKDHNGEKPWHSSKCFSLLLALCTHRLVMLIMDSAFLVYFMVLVCWDYSEIFTFMLTLKLGMTKKVNEPMSSGLYCNTIFMARLTSTFYLKLWTLNSFLTNCYLYIWCMFVKSDAVRENIHSTISVLN